jgi:hypothetical protein
MRSNELCIGCIDGMVGKTTSVYDNVEFHVLSYHQQRRNFTQGPVQDDLLASNIILRFLCFRDKLRRNFQVVRAYLQSTSPNRGS